MGIDIDQAIKQLDESFDRLKEQIELALEAAAMEGFALVEQRIIETGMDSKGQPFKPYSKNKLPWFFFEEVEVVRKVKPEEKKKFPDGISYDEWKTLIGRNPGYVNFKLTGSMFRRIGLVEKKNQEGRFVVVIGGRDKQTTDKMKWNDNLRPGWFTLSDSEIQIITESFKTRVETAIDNIFASS